MPPRFVGIAYILAVVCFLAPLAILGAGFAGAVLIRRGRPGHGMGVIAVAVLCAVGGVLLRTSSA
jgi:hypothetical protein